MNINVSVKHEGLLNDLIIKYPCLYFLKGRELKHSDRLKWYLNNTQDIAYWLQVTFVGKTGYGKSTTINNIVGKDVFASSDIESCTKESQASIFKICDYSHLYYFVLADLPGVGESIDRDDEYTELYSSFLDISDTIVYVLRADQRDFAIDESVFKRLFHSKKKRKKVIIALNCVDKIEPLNRKLPFKLSSLQLNNLQKKTKIISDIFEIPLNRIVYYSATENYNLDGLVRAVAQNLSERIEKWT